MELAERQKIRLLREIPDYDYASSLRRVQAVRCEGTCLWLLGRTEFKDWIDRKDTEHLCCYGIRKDSLLSFKITLTDSYI
jgi:hypothetical protein